MSTSEEIRSVFNEDIEKMSNLVEKTYGKYPFYGNFKDFTIFEVYGGLGIDKIVCSEYTPRGNTDASD